jgi:cytochrome c oxidase assembly protein subunit 16
MKGRTHPAITFGLPFLVFMVGGTYALSYFTQLRYDQYDKKTKMLTTREVRDLDSEDRLRDLKQEYEVRPCETSFII